MLLCNVPSKGCIEGEVYHFSKIYSAIIIRIIFQIASVGEVYTNGCIFILPDAHDRPNVWNEAKDKDDHPD